MPNNVLVSKISRTNDQGSLLEIFKKVFLDLLDLDLNLTPDGYLSVNAVNSEGGEKLILNSPVIYSQTTLDEFFTSLEDEIKQTLMNIVVNNIMHLDEDSKFSFIKEQVSQMGQIMLHSHFVEGIEESFLDHHIERSFQLNLEEI